ncbi:hypothetical protein AYO38_06230 [bacterium SCGC AG-212-C10]|nr:hypothetical protein AYO38_06230 [bacterium SCGC AG-212-C10]
MMQAQFQVARGGRPGYVEPVLVLLVLVGTAGAGVGLAFSGPAALLLPLIIICALGVAMAPYGVLLTLLVSMIIIEPGAIDGTGSLSPMLYSLPAGVRLPLTTSPIEIVVFLAAAFSLRRRDRLASIRLPRLVYLVPITIALGFAYGAINGGDIHIGYNEARGLIFGICVFVIVASGEPLQLRRLGTCVIVATGILAAVIVWRYFTIVKPGDLDVPLEFAFAHESSVILGIGFVSAITLMTKSEVRGWQRVVLIGYCMLICLAFVVSQRRAATLVALTGALTVAGLVYGKRPLMVVLVSIPILLGFAVYVGAYWNKEYGASAQPARAIRSQISPSARDESSDLYRTNERTSVIETIRANKVFGVGFGRQFAQYQPLPNLESFWPLQFYTPHESLLWLWLKLGFLGLSAFLGVVGLAVARCVHIVRRSTAIGDREVLAIITAATLLMYLAFSTVDIAMVGPRGAVPLAVALAIAFALPPPALDPDREAK